MTRKQRNKYAMHDGNRIISLNGWECMRVIKGMQCLAKQTRKKIRKRNKNYSRGDAVVIRGY